MGGDPVSDDCRSGDSGRRCYLHNTRQVKSFPAAAAAGAAIRARKPSTHTIPSVLARAIAPDRFLTFSLL
jgi:hypothetical protein